MKKTAISKSFFYRHRFSIGYLILGLIFVVILFVLPVFYTNHLSPAEMSSATSSVYLAPSSIMDGDLVDLPYRLLQKYSIKFFGLTTYAIKLPSMLVGLLLGFLLILLLNRWFKSNVSLLASCLVILSTPFLYLASSGTPLIMLVFWPTLLLWLGSKIQGEKRPEPLYCFAFALALLLAIFTPYMLYFAIFCVIFVFIQPHLRFIVKNLPKAPLIITGIIILGGLTALALNIISHPNTILELLFATNFNLADFFTNIITGITPVFSWYLSQESIFMSPLISLPIFAIALIGLFSTTKGFFASRNSIASMLLIFTVIITGFRSDAIIFFILPLAILIAHGLKYILAKWYDLFPENPYARIFALFPLTILFGFIILPSLSQYALGYHYNPNVANQFSDDLNIIRRHFTSETLIVPSDQLAFYQILTRTTNLTITDTIPTDATTIAILDHATIPPANYQLSRIITSSKSDNSDRIYLYTKGE